MTRFNITLKEGVEFVLFAIKDMLGGNIYSKIKILLSKRFD